MSDIISAAIKFGADLYGTSAETVWCITFITDETKHGHLTALDNGFFSLLDEEKLFIFHTDEVVHVSPDIPTDQVLKACTGFK